MEWICVQSKPLNLIKKLGREVSSSLYRQTFYFYILWNPMELYNGDLLLGLKLLHMLVIQSIL